MNPNELPIIFQTQPTPPLSPLPCLSVMFIERQYVKQAMKWHADNVNSKLHLPEDVRKEWEEMRFETIMKKFDLMVKERNTGKGLKEDEKGWDREYIGFDYEKEPDWYRENM